MKIKKIGLRRQTTALLWTLLIGSVLFGIYKNFTAIDQHTIHEEKIIKTKIIDTHFITSFVEEFAQVYYSWLPTKEAIEKRSDDLTNYLSEDLVQINQEMIRSDIPTKSLVKNIKIWKVNQLNSTDYVAVFSVTQEIEESIGNRKTKKEFDSAFSVRIRTKGDNQLVVLTNPVMTAVPKRLAIKSQPQQDDMAINQTTKDEIKSFLNTFFKVYPTAKKIELHYYVQDKNIQEINKDYLFSEIKQINYFQSKDGVIVKVVAVYLDKETKAILPFTYELIVEKVEEKWVIKSGI